MGFLNNILGSSAYWQVNKDLAKKTSINSALLLSDLIAKYDYFEERNLLVEHEGDFYFYATSDSIEDDTTLSYKLQKNSLDELKKHGLIKTKLMGIPAKQHFAICEDKILTLLNSSFAQKSKLESPKGQNYYNKNKENKNKETRIKNNDAEKKIFSEQSQNETFDLDSKKNEGKEKSCAKKENVEKLPHPCDKTQTKFMGEYIEEHGDGELHLKLVEFFNKDKESEEPKSYEPEMYKEFKSYWTALVQIGKAKGKERWRTEKTFSVASRLATWAKGYKSKQQQQKQNGNRNEWNAEQVGLGAIAILRQRQQERAELKRQQQQTIISLQDE